MTKKKNGFLTFIFSLMPGAGEMYMGFMKQGVSLMGAFFLLIFLATWFGFGELLFALPILWCYGFFHVHNLRGMPDEEFYALEDDYLFHLDRILPEGQNLSKKYRCVLAVILIAMGASMLLHNLEHVVRWCLPDYVLRWYQRIVNVMPQLVIAVLFIVGGIWLIRGKKKELDKEEAEEEANGKTDGKMPTEETASGEGDRL